MLNGQRPMSRRRALALGGSMAGGLVVAASPLLGTAGRADADAGGPTTASSGTSLPVSQIEAIMQTTGTVQDGVLTIELDRNDLNVTGPQGIPFKPAFEENHQFYFQDIGGGKAFLNAEMTFTTAELDAVTSAIFRKGLIPMGMHQHFIGESPQTWHVHFRGINDPISLAQKAIAVVQATGTPLPQTQPSNPTTPLPASQLASILGGTAQIGSDGVVTVSVARAETIVVAGVPLKPEMGVEHTIAFEPLDSSGTTAACAPDYALIAAEVDAALEKSWDLGFEVYCLYNQETAEQPQLYFSHNLAKGDPIDLAQKARQVLDLTNTRH